MKNIYNGLIKRTLYIGRVICRTEEPLVQNTPPPSKPQHRQAVPLKPCVESPDLLTKQHLEEQKSAMLERRKLNYMEQLQKHNRLF